MLRARLRAVAVLCAVATMATIAVYLPTLWFGFRYDDYHEMRPWTAAELRGVFHGTWDPTGIEPRFYRPLTACWFALRFAIFGVNGVAQHALSLAGMAVCAALTGLFVWRITGRLFPGVVGAALFGVYPAFVYAQAVWLTNQMHLAASVLVLIGLLAWQRACVRGGAAWVSLIAIQVVAFGFKEDTIVFLPLVAILTAIRAWTRRDVRLPRPAIVVVAAVVVIGLPYWRYVTLAHRLGGYGRPSFARGMQNLRRGLDVLLQRPAHRPWQAFAGWYSAAAIAAGTLASAIRRRTATLFLIVCGLLTAFCFNLPFYLVAKPEQYHLVGLGCVLALTGAIDGVQQFARRPGLRMSSGAVALVCALPFGLITRNIVEDFAPCSSITLYTDTLVVGWPVVPSEIKDWIAAKPQACASGSLKPLEDSLTTATWALGLEHDQTDAPVEWTSDRAVMLVRRDVARVNIAVRSPIAAPHTPVTVTLEYGRAPLRMALTDSSWHEQTIHFDATALAWLQGMNRLDLQVAPVFVPAERFRNGDTRVLGVLMRIPQPIADKPIRRYRAEPRD